MAKKYISQPSYEVPEDWSTVFGSSKPPSKTVSYIKRILVNIGWGSVLLGIFMIMQNRKVYRAMRDAAIATGMVVLWRQGNKQKKVQSNG